MQQILAILLIMILIFGNFFVIYILFNNRWFGKVLFFLQAISFIIIQFALWNYIERNFLLYFTVEGLIAFLITVASYIFILFFSIKSIIIKIIINNFIKNDTPKNVILNKDLLSKFNYLFYQSIKKYKKTKIVYSYIYDLQQMKRVDTYFVRFYILSDENNKKRLFVYNAKFSKKIFKHLKKCPNCGSNNNADNLYCDYCHTKLIDEANIIEIEKVDMKNSLNSIEVLNIACNNIFLLSIFFINLFYLLHLLIMHNLASLIGILAEQGFISIIVYLIIIFIPFLVICKLELGLSDFLGKKTIHEERYGVINIIIGTSFITAFISIYILIILVAIKLFMILIDYIKFNSKNN